MSTDYQNAIDAACQSWEDANLCGNPELDEFARRAAATLQYGDPVDKFGNSWQPDSLRVVAEIEKLPKPMALAAIALLSTWLPSIVERRKLARLFVEKVKP